MPSEQRLRPGRASALGLAAAAAVLATCGALAGTLPTSGGPATKHRAPRVLLISLPAPRVVISGTPVPDDARGVPYGTATPDQGADCTLSACWSYLVSRAGYLYPVAGSYDATAWHVAGPALAGPGIDPRNPYLGVVARSASSALVWINRDEFASTSDGGHRWWLIRGITHRVGIGVGRGVAITVGFPAQRSACDYYYTYVSNTGVVWRRGGLTSFITTGLMQPPPSCVTPRRDDPSSGHRQR